MKPLLDIIYINQSIVYFVYGQVFFTLGVAVAIQSRKHSRLALAQTMWLFALFAIVHAFNEWAHVFIPIQATYLPRGTVDALHGLSHLILAASFYFLLEFGFRIAFPDLHKRLWWKHIPGALALLWLAAIVSLGLFHAGGPVAALRLPEAEASARVLLGLPGAAVTSYGFWRQPRTLGENATKRIGRYFRWTAVFMACYAILATFTGETVPWLAAHWQALFSLERSLELPTPLLRSAAALGIAYWLSRGLEVFQMETDRYMADREDLRRKEEERALLLGRVIHAQEDERKRVARELHDETGQSLSAVIMGLGAAAETLHRDPYKAADILDDTRETAVEALDGLRQIILGLRPAILDDLGLVPALRHQAEELSRRSGVEIKLYADRLEGRLPAPVETVLFRILQEGLNNTARHSKALRAELRLYSIGDGVTATLVDDGIGFDPQAARRPKKDGRGLGLHGMLERAAMVGGRLDIESAPGQGARIKVHLPVVEGDRVE